jgi:DNA-binding protein YbaB
MINMTASNASFELAGAVYAAMAGFVVAAVIKIANKLFDKDKDQLETHVLLRKELREELDIVKKELQELQSELDEWKERYYNQVKFTNELKLSFIQLSGELENYKIEISKLREDSSPVEGT